MNVLRRAWQVWHQFGRFLGDALARVVLTIFYFTIFVPFGLGVRWLGDPLDVKLFRARWRARATHDVSLAGARRLS